MFKKTLLVAMTVSALSTGSVVADTSVRVLSQILPTAKQYPNEAVAIEALKENGFKVQYNNYDGLGLSTADGLRLVSDNAFNIASVQIGTAARDDAFFEGLDLIGVSTDTESLKDAVDSYREVFDARLQSASGQRFWHSGHSVHRCSIATLM